MGETFGWATKQLHNGDRVCRSGWNGKDMFLVLVEDWQGTFRKGFVRGVLYKHLPFICLKTADGCLVPWVASQTDVLATDWEVVSLKEFLKELVKEAGLCPHGADLCTPCDICAGMMKRTSDGVAR
jgi:hypothetical protein